MKFFNRIAEAEMGSIAVNHRQIVILIAFMKAEPEAEAVGE